MQTSGRGGGTRGRHHLAASLGVARWLGIVGLLAVAFGATVAPVGAADSDLALINMPTDITTTATQLGGAVVNYTLPTNGDVDDSDGVVTCTPNTGSVFAIGTTTVNCILNDPNDDTNNPVSATFTVTVAPGPAAQLSLNPGDTSATVGTSVTETATVADQYGNPVADGTPVAFSVTGITTTGGTVPTTSGQAAFTYSAILPGTDTLTATAQGGTNPSASATITWTLPASTPGASLLINSPGVRVRAETDLRADPPLGLVQWLSGVTFESRQLTALTVSGTSATLFGTGTLPNGTVVEFRLDATAGPGGGTARLQLSTGFDSGTLTGLSVAINP